MLYLKQQRCKRLRGREEAGCPEGMPPGASVPGQVPLKCALEPGAENVCRRLAGVGCTVRPIARVSHLVPRIYLAGWGI